MNSIPRPPGGCAPKPRFILRAMRHPPGTAAGLACGIVSIVLAWMPFLSLPAVLLALVFSRRALARTDPALSNGPAMAARVCALVGFALSMLVAFWLWLVLSAVAEVGGRHHQPPPEQPAELLW